MVAKLSDVKKKCFEEDFRNYRSLRNEAIAALVNAEWKPEDLNSWIKGSREHSQVALTNLIKREDNRIYTNRMEKVQAIDKTMEELAPELREIVIKYMWGPYDYLSWPEVADKEHCAKSTIYEWRAKILETYARNYGEID